MANQKFDFSAIPEPKMIDVVSYEQLFQERKARLLELAPEYEPALQLDSEPLVIALQVESYREYMLRKRVNEALKSNLLAMAQSADLDHLGLFYGVMRSDNEMDDEYRIRIRDRTIASSTAGSKEHYRSRAIEVAPNQIKDIEVDNPVDPQDPTRNCGLVSVAVLVKYSLLEKNRSLITYDDKTGADQVIKSLQVDFQAVVSDLIEAEEESREAQSDRLLMQIVDRVNTAISADDVKVLTDTLAVQAAELVPMTIEAQVYLDEDTPELVFDNLIVSLISTWEKKLSLGWDIAPSWLHAQLHREGVRYVNLCTPKTLEKIKPNQCAIPMSIKLTLLR